MADAPPAVRVRPGGTYLVTGGLGGIGLAMAERLARDYQARLVLMGRTKVPPREEWGRILASAVALGSLAAVALYGAVVSVGGWLGLLRRAGR